MPARLWMTTGDDGRPLVVKEAGPGPAADRLAHEAALLEAARHPGVVDLVRSTSATDGGFTLVTRLAGTRTLTDPPDDPAAIADLLAAVAATLADLHALGVVHGRVRAEHVVVTGDGRPVLCGFGGAARAGTAPVGGDAPLQPAHDLAALEVLRRELLLPVPPTRAPARRWWLAAAALLGVASAVAVVVNGEGAGSPSVPVAAPTTAPPTSVPEPPPLPGGSGLAGSCDPAPVPQADPDGDGCGDTAVVDGGVVTVGPRRYVVGDADDRIVVGDWDCDGEATAAGLRPATGEVFLFDGWAVPGRDLVGTATTTVRGAVDLVPEGDPACPTLVAVDAIGSRTAVTGP